MTICANHLCNRSFEPPRATAIYCWRSCRMGQRKWLRMRGEKVVRLMIFGDGRPIGTALLQERQKLLNEVAMGLVQHPTQW